MENYKKPSIVGTDLKEGLIPLAAILGGAAAAAGATAIAGAAVNAVVGGALLAGVAGGLMARSSKGANIIDSFRTSTLTARKNFALE